MNVRQIVQEAQLLHDLSRWREVSSEMSSVSGSLNVEHYDPVGWKRITNDFIRL